MGFEGMSRQDGVEVFVGEAVEVRVGVAVAVMVTVEVVEIGRAHV